jgi:nondiscriminating aspartyl-tRNA synthetase
MKRILTSELPAHPGERVPLRGWLHRTRRLSRVSFVVLRDRAGLAQLVVDPPLPLLPEAVIEVEGLAVASAQAPGGVEVQTTCPPA